MTWLILLLVAVVVVVLVVRNNKKEAEMFAGKIKSVADVNHDGKVDLQDVKAAVAIRGKSIELTIFATKNCYC